MFASRIRGIVLLGILSIAVIALMIGCSSEQPTAVPATATPVPATATPTGIQYPLTITDMMGRTVEIGEKPERIVAISPTAMEMLYEVGGKAVGRSSSARFSEEVIALPDVGGAYNPSIETIVTLRPDLLLIESLTQGHMTQMLGSLETPIVAVRATSVNDINQGLSLIGKIVDLEDEAEAAVAEIDSRIKDTVASSSRDKSVLILIADEERNFYAALPDSYPGAIASILGLSNVADGMQASGPYPGFTLYSPEQAVTSNPNVILAITPAPEPVPRLTSALAFVPGFKDLDAVTSGRAVEIDPVVFLRAQGPRIADAVESLGSLLGNMDFSEAK